MRISGSDAIIVMDNEVWYCIDGLPNRNLWRDFLNFPYFTGFPAPLNSEMICIFPYFCPYAESAREIREVFI